MNWSSLESLPALAAVPSVWEQLLGENFPPFRILCLHPSADLLTHIPCPNHCGCDHFIIPRHDLHGAVAACCCNPPTCPDLPLTLPEITPLALDWTRLAYAICQALLCQVRLAKLTPHNTFQIGSWSASAVPVILTIKFQRSTFRGAVAELVASINHPFILLAPSARHLDANCLSVLHQVRAGFFDLQSNLTLTRRGILEPIQDPRELFAQFTAESALPIPHSALPVPHSKYALRKGLGVWSLTFEGKHAQLKHERGIFYVAWLLTHPPPEPIHALDLAAKIPEIYRRQLAPVPVLDPITGKATPLLSHARIQERSLALDATEALRALARKEAELEAILDDDDQPEPVKHEALRDLEAIAEFQKQHGRRTVDNAQRVVRAVRRAITRFHHRLSHSLARNGLPHPVLRPFAAHLNQHLLIPSARSSGPAATRTRRSLAGCFTYEPPTGVIWVD